MITKVVAVVVTYNRKDLLLECIRAVLRQKAVTTDVLVVDNASTDGTATSITELYGDDARVIYMNTGSNLGGAGGFSFGINAAVNLGYDYLWIMDDDTIPDDTALYKLLNAADILNDDFGFLSSFVKWTDGTPCVMNIPMISPRWNKTDIRMQFDNRMIMLESASFVSMLIRTDVVKKVGLPIKEFIIWADDAEYALRISKLYRSFYVYDSQVVHAIKNNIPASIVSEKDVDRLKRFQYLYRNKRYIARHNGLRAWVSYRLEIIQTLCRILKGSKSMKLKKCGIVLSSSLSGFFFRPRIEKVHSYGDKQIA